MNVLGDNGTISRENVFLMLDISNKLGKEYVHMFDDMTRMAVIQITIQLMTFMSSPSVENISIGEFFLLLVYILLGVAFYWLVVRNLVAFK